MRVGTLAGGQSRIVSRTVVTPDPGVLATTAGDGTAEAASADDVTPLTAATHESVDGACRCVEIADTGVIESVQIASHAPGR